VTAWPARKSIPIHILLFAWEHATPIDCQVAVGVMRFDSDTNGQVSLVACWSLRNANGKELAMRKGLQVRWCLCSMESPVAPVAPLEQHLNSSVPPRPLI
jgi:ABC-type transport auxiliary lipoprotein component